MTWAVARGRPLGDNRFNELTERLAKVRDVNMTSSVTAAPTNPYLAASEFWIAMLGRNRPPTIWGAALEAVERFEARAGCKVWGTILGYFKAVEDYCFYLQGGTPVGADGPGPWQGPYIEPVFDATALAPGDCVLTPAIQSALRRCARWPLSQKAHTRAAIVLEVHGHREWANYVEMLPELPEVYRSWLNDEQEKDFSWSLMYLIPWRLTKDWRGKPRMVPRLTGELSVVRGRNSPYRRETLPGSMGGRSTKDC